VLVLASVVHTAHARPFAAGDAVVGDGTPASCTEAALTAALANGDHITFNCGGPKTILILSEKSITHNTSIDGGGNITITGGLATRLFSTVPGAGTALDFRNIILDSAFSNNASGAAIRAFGPLTLTNVTIQNSTAAPGYCGGAVLIAGDALIANSTFNKNTAALGGGAICARSLPANTVLVRDSLFTNNQGTDTTSGFGGAIYVDSSSKLSVLDSVFLSNSAHFGGGAYVGPSASLEIQGSRTSSIFASKMQLNANSASEDGGALYNKGGTLTIDSAVITVNRTPMQTLLAGYGGAIYNEGVLSLRNSIVSQNEGRYGGGVFVGNSTAGARADIDHVSFRLNTSGNLGGGLYTNGDTTTITITNSAFSSNTAATGGGLARFNAALRVYNSSFTQNTATSGGGLFLSAGPSPTSGPYVRVQNVTVSGNTATGGQGGGLLNTGTAELYSMTIVGNTGGVFSGNNGNTRFRDTVLQNAGSLNCDGDGTASISDDAKNFSTDNSCALPNSQTGIGLDPKLAPLALDPRGGTSYYTPLAGSPLINAGFNCLDYDQLGASRPDACDIGAVEFGGRLPRAFIPVAVR
jgi:predicted outer membrane repeat protein